VIWTPLGMSITSCTFGFLSPRGWAGWSLWTDTDGLVIVTNEAQYLQPVHYPATLDVRMGGHSPGRSSFMSTYTLHQGERLMTRGSARVVWIDVQNNKSKPLPGKILSLLAGTDHA